MSVFNHAQWIMPQDSAPAVDSYYDYIQDFSVSGEKPVVLYISAHTTYAVYVNDRFVDCGQLPDSEVRKVYDTLDLTPFVRPGKNQLKITHYVTGEVFFTTTDQIPGLIFSLYAGETELAYSSEHTLSGRNVKYLSKAEKITGQLGFNFDYNATAPETEYAPSRKVEKPGALIPRPVKKLTIGEPHGTKLLSQGVFLENDPSLPNSKRIHTAYLSAVTKKQMITVEGDQVSFAVPEGTRADGVYLLFDLGGETIGYPQLQLEVDRETEILVGFGEHLEDLRVRSSCGSRHYCFRYVAKPGENLFFHPFRRLGLRYMQLHIYNEKGSVRQATVRPTRYPMKKKPAPVTDRLHKRIWDTASKTLDLCMQDYYCDCIIREQSMYPYDGRMESLYSYYGFDAPEYAREALRICADTLRADGLLEICAPGRDIVTVPSYSGTYIRAILEYTQHTGDMTLAEEVFEVLRTIVEGFENRIAENGLLPMYHGAGFWHFYEWQPGLDGKIPGTVKKAAILDDRYELPLNAFITDGICCFGELCRTLRPELAEKYMSLGEAMKKALHEVFYVPEKGGYLTRLGETEPIHELTQGLMLYLDAVPAACRPGVEALVREKKLVRSTLGLSVYTYEGMMKHGENRRFVLEDMEARWCMMLDRGADTFWETELGADDFNGAGALCQGWSAMPLYLFAHYGLGEL